HDDTVNLPRQDRRYWTAEVAGQRERADRRTVEDLDPVRRRCRLLLTVALEERDRIDEARITPRLVRAQGLLVDDDVGSRLVDHGVSAVPQRRQDGRLAGARRAGDDVSLHRWQLLLGMVWGRCTRWPANR